MIMIGRLSFFKGKGKGKKMGEIQIILNISYLLNDDVSKSDNRQIK